MILPPITLTDLSLIFALEAIVLLITSEVASSHVLANLSINKRRLHRTAIIMGVLFLITVLIKAIELMINT